MDISFIKIAVSINDCSFCELELLVDSTVADELTAEYNRMAQQEDFDGELFYDKLKVSRPDLATAVDKAVKEELTLLCDHYKGPDSVDYFPIEDINCGLDTPDHRGRYVSDPKYNRYKYDFTYFLDDCW